jgi:hypothetical protein
MYTYIATNTHRVYIYIRTPTCWQRGDGREEGAEAGRQAGRRCISQSVICRMCAVMCRRGAYGIPSEFLAPCLKLPRFMHVYADHRASGQVRGSAGFGVYNSVLLHVLRCIRTRRQRCELFLGATDSLT